MPVFKLPLSGDVVQSINPLSGWFSPGGGQYGLVNINLGLSSDPNVEADVLSDVATYGRQLGRIGDALVVLVNHMPTKNLTKREKESLKALQDMLAKIAEVKARHRRPSPPQHPSPPRHPGSPSAKDAVP